MDKSNIYTILGAIAFIIGLGLLSFIAWLLVGANNPDIPLKTVNNSGAVMIVGLALIAVGMIVIAFSKTKK